MFAGAFACLLGGALRKSPSFKLLSLLSLLRFACEMQRLVSALRFVAGNSALAAATISLIGHLRAPPWAEGAAEFEEARVVPVLLGESASVPVRDGV